MPSRSAAIWPTTVMTPVPISCAASWTRARPSEDSCTRAVAAPADQPVAVAHRAGRRRALRPAERFGRLVVASHQRAAGPGLAGRVLHGVVDAAQFDRV